MNAAAALDRVLPLFQAYYNIKRDDVTAPFDAEASFSLHNEQYFLSKKAKLAEENMFEHIFFSALDELTPAKAKELEEIAWNEGIRRAQPGPNHRCTDVTLILLADRIQPEAASFIKKLHRSKSYRFLLYGYSNYRAIAIETSTGRMTCNRLGQHLKKLFSNINFLE